MPKPYKHLSLGGSRSRVIADHSCAFQTNAQSRVRFTQAGAVLKEDSLTRVETLARMPTASLSCDYRSLSLRPQQQTGQLLSIRCRPPWPT